MFLPFLNFMKRPRTKFHADSMSDYYFDFIIFISFFNFTIGVVPLDDEV